MHLRSDLDIEAFGERSQPVVSSHKADELLAERELPRQLLRRHESIGQTSWKFPTLLTSVMPVPEML
jgi:hypothetical protein